ncbi:hypothetical protein B4U80_11468 [Leptotrombidium deliense]|uniref:Uncharacterized protein n=1 Tax=Leptotrombidium deliense TaxID=299467 RepID=A0A443QCJ1_9ACAR|nr:hypothetical protein B4U80_11468 [Leptotrombidium deliense]
MRTTCRPSPTSARWWRASSTSRWPAAASARTGRTSTTWRAPTTPPPGAW